VDAPFKSDGSSGGSTAMIVAVVGVVIVVAVLGYMSSGSPPAADIVVPSPPGAPEDPNVTALRESRDVRACFDARSRADDAGPRKPVDFVLTLSPSGRVLGASIVTDDSDLEKCLLGAVTAVRFPAPTAGHNTIDVRTTLRSWNR
jgi:hypothetical protein